jgi:hypothetical protein
MRKFILTASIAAIGALGLTAAGPAAANEASPCGATHGAFANVNGNFGWLGEDGGTPGYHEAKGQEEGATGYNNKTASEAVCQP